jgi:murein DD-endopeptidase MepM/ murein hydrolase activator NlpD
MKIAAIFAALALVACAGAAPAEPAQNASHTAASHADASLSGPSQTGASPAALALRCAGAFTQGGMGLCRTTPGAAIFIDGVASGAADEHGWAIIGFTREHPASARVEARLSGQTAEQDIAVSARTFTTQAVNGLPQDTVTPPQTPDVQARLAREFAEKQQGFASLAPLEGWLEGFEIPVQGVNTSPWGNARILNGREAPPHFGYDIAAPTGTPVHAPASGVVTLAEPDMFYEGGLVFIDHGQGLITMYLHMSRVDVHVGDHVLQGQVLGAVGAKGLATGPHLCWRMKWRDRQLDPSQAISGLAAARAALGAQTNETAAH